MADEKINFGEPIVVPKAKPTKPLPSSKSSPSAGGNGGQTIDNILPWLMAGGGGLLAHTITSSMFDDKTEQEKRNESAWMKLVRTLIPLGIGVAGAYGGYRLGKGLGEKKAQAGGGEKVFPFTREGRTEGPEYAPESSTNMVGNVSSWGRKNNYGPNVPIQDVARRDADEKNLYSNISYYGGAPLFGILSGKKVWDTFNQLPFMKGTEQAVTQEEAARAQAKLNARTLTDAERTQALKRVAEYDDAMAAGRLTTSDVAAIDADIAQLRSGLKTGRSAAVLRENAEILGKIRRLEALKTTGGILPREYREKYMAARQKDVDALGAKEPSKRWFNNQEKKLRKIVDKFDRSQRGLPAGSWKDFARNLSQALLAGGAAYGSYRLGEHFGEKATGLNDFADKVESATQRVQELQGQ